MRKHLHVDFLQVLGLLIDLSLKTCPLKQLGLPSHVATTKSRICAVSAHRNIKLAWNGILSHALHKLILLFLLIIILFILDMLIFVTCLLIQLPGEASSMGCLLVISIAILSRVLKVFLTDPRTLEPTSLNLLEFEHIRSCLEFIWLRGRRGIMA